MENAGDGVPDSYGLPRASQPFVSADIQFKKQ